MKFILNSFLVISFFTGCEALKGPSLDNLWTDFLAKQEIKKEKYEEALQHYYNLIQSDFENYEPHSNIGVLMALLQKPEDALKSLQYSLSIAEKNKDLKGQFATHFNLGSYFATQKKVQEAIDQYQAALDVVPSSIETKTNIELLIQQQKKDQQKQNGEGKGEGQSQPDQKQNKDGKGNDNKDQKDQKDKKDPQDKKDDQNKNDDKDKEKDSQEKERQNSPKYKPRPFQGEQLSEGDVKKILGELRNQEQKIRANFEKKEKGKSSKNEKDW